MVQEGLAINPGAAHPVNVQNQAAVKVQRDAQPEDKNIPQEDGIQPVQKKLDPELLSKIAEELNEDFRIFNTTISFSVDENTGNTVIKIMDRESEKVIREIPPLELLRLASRLAEIIGRIVDETA